MKCHLCSSTKQLRPCEECGEPTCKACIRYLDQELAVLHPKPPKCFRSSIFCVDCYEKEAAAEVHKMEETLQKAFEVLLIRKNYRGMIRSHLKAKEPLDFAGHKDKKEALLHLCFVTAWMGFNAVLSLEVEFKKVRHFGYEKKEWVARGLPVTIEDISKVAGNYHTLSNLG